MKKKNYLQHLIRSSISVAGIILFCSVFLLSSCMDNKEKVTAADLKCSNLTNPEGIDKPLFSWKIKTSGENVVQTAWEIEIASEMKLLENNKPDTWSSGKCVSGQQFNIEPAGVQLKEMTMYYWRVRIWDNKDKASEWSSAAGFSTGPAGNDSWTGKWITFPYASDKPLPYFRKEFKIKNKKQVDKGLVYFCGLGAGELYMNGSLVDSTGFLDPAQTNYEQYALYSTFDVTNLLNDGDNCIGVMLGNGWFAQDKAWGGAPFSYGDPMFRLQLVVFHEDGSKEVTGSDDSWLWQEGPVVKSNIYMGEVYDSRKEIDGWNIAGAQEVDGWKKAVYAQNNCPPGLYPQLIPPIRKKEAITAKKLRQDSAGRWIYDFGVNVAGIPFLEVNQPPDTRLVIRFAEEVDDKGELDFITTGWIHHGDIFKDEYICRGGGKDEKWSPRFTYHGYRYAELSGFSGDPGLSALKLIPVYSDVENTGVFDCSDEQINQLHEIALRTVKGNLHGIPTDCPIREKCGWLGDVHAYVKMANLNFQMDNFWSKYLADIRSGASKEEENTLFHERYNNTFYFAGKPAGIPYMIAPGKRLCGVASPDWGTALVQLPWWMYIYNGNKQILEEYYPLMKQWTDYVASLARNAERTGKYNSSTKYIVYQGLGDWCPPLYDKADKTPVEFTSTAFHYLDTHIMEQVALILGKEDDAKAFASDKEGIVREIISGMYDGKKKTFGTQTADVLALDLGFVPAGDEKAVSDAIVRNMNEKNDGFMNCGIFGLCRIGSVLARNGNAEAAWKMFTKKGRNSFEWMWKEAAATTLWEALPVNETTQKNAYAVSHNHPMQAGYDVMFFEDIAGIRPEDNTGGFKIIRFEPLFCDYLSWAKASVETSYGTVSSSWKNENNIFEWEISIPANTTGLVTFPLEGELSVNGGKLDNSNHPQIENSDGTVSHLFHSGNYNITIQY